jgi:SAM-dependent methyltransferase
VALGHRLGWYRALAEMTAALIGTLPRLTEVYRGQATQSWADLGDRVRDALAATNRPFFLGPLVEQYLPALPGVDAALRAGGRVADLGCGYGWSTIGIASHWPAALVDGFDNDAPSLKQARANAAAYGVADRVRFHDDPSTAQPGCYDLVAAFDCIHDQSDPVAMLATMRLLCKPGGTVLVVDEAAAERFTAPGDPADQLLYGLSMLCCLPASRAHGPSAATGSVMRPDTLRAYALSAGYADVESLTPHDDYRCYRLLLA